MTNRRMVAHSARNKIHCLFFRYCPFPCFSIDGSFHMLKDTKQWKNIALNAMPSPPEMHTDDEPTTIEICIF